jgi:hypothetical protein
MKNTPKIQEIVNIANSLNHKNIYQTAVRWTAYLDNGYLIQLCEQPFNGFIIYLHSCGDNSNLIIENNRRLYLIK